VCLTLDLKASPSLAEADVQRIDVAAAPKAVTSVTTDLKTGSLRQALIEFDAKSPVDRQLVAGLGRALTERGAYSSRSAGARGPSTCCAGTGGG